MYYVSKRMEIAGAHFLELPYPSKCSNLHGHNWIVTVHCCSRRLTSYGMVLDFATIKNVVSDKYDHKCINDVFEIQKQIGDDIKNPTAENMAYRICLDVNFYLETQADSYAICHCVEVQESEGNAASYEMPPEQVDWLLDKIMKGEKGE